MWENNAVYSEHTAKTKQNNNSLKGNSLQVLNIVQRLYLDTTVTQAQLQFLTDYMTEFA